jgi:hypothetical protein
MAKEKDDDEKFYTLIIMDSDGEVIHKKAVKVDLIDKANFTKHHKVKALLNILSK